MEAKLKYRGHLITDAEVAAIRAFISENPDSSRHALLNCAGTVRSRNATAVSPKRAVAGSSGVPTRAWWPRTCSTVKCS